MKVSHQVQRLSAVVLILAMLMIAACSGGGTSSSGDDMEVSVDGATLLEERCTQCHGLDRVTSANKTEAEWRANVEDMIQKGAELNDEEKEILVAYLADTYGP